MDALDTNQLDDVLDELLKRVGTDEIMSALFLANQRGSLDAFLESMGQEGILEDLGLLESSKVKKVVVIGESAVKEKVLKGIARKVCPESDGYVFEYKLTYNVKKYNFDKMRNNDSYLAVIAGPMPHSAQGKGDGSSMIATMENNPESWPHVIRMTSSSGELKFTKSAFEKALERVLSL